MPHEADSPTPPDRALDMSAMWGETFAATTGDARGDWFRDSRFAMFIHWGLYSEAAGSWAGRAYHGIAEWLMYSARIPVREYEQLAARFNPGDFDAAAWVRLAQEAGMKYLVITAKHHDGFAMFRSRVSPYNIADATPFGRDPLAELAGACAAAGMPLGFYYSQYQDWHEPDAAGNAWDFSGPRHFDRYLREKAMPQIEELLTGYGPVALIWFDTPGNITREASQELLDTVRRLQPNCLVNSRLGHGLGDYVTLGDQEVPLTAPPDCLWETIDTHNDTWGYSAHDHNWKSPRELISRLVRVASLGGNYLLNVGPTGRGAIPEVSATILRKVGAWIARHPESLYGTQPSPLGLQAWGGSTSREGRVYLHVLDRPPDGRLWLPGGREPLTLPPCTEDDLPAVVELPATDLPESPLVRVWLHPGLTSAFPAPHAALVGCTLGRRSWMEKFGEWHHLDVLEDWSTGATAEWEFTAPAPGVYYLYAAYECLHAADGSEFEITLGDTRLTFPVVPTGGDAQRTRVRTVRLGRVEVPAANGTLTFRALALRGERAFLLARLALEPFV